MEPYQAELGELEYEFSVNTEKITPVFYRTRSIAISMMVLLAVLAGVASVVWSEHWKVLVFMGIAFIVGISGYLLLCRHQLKVMVGTSLRLYDKGLLYVAPNMARVVTYSDIMDIQLRGGPTTHEVLVQGGIEFVSHLTLGPLGMLTPAFFDSKKAGCFLYTRTGPRLRVPSFIPRLDLLVELIRERQLTR